MTDILSDTLAPPKIATKGVLGSSTALPIKSISFFIKNPDAVGKCWLIPTFEACSR